MGLSSGAMYVLVCFSVSTRVIRSLLVRYPPLYVLVSVAPFVSRLRLSMPWYLYLFFKLVPPLFFFFFRNLPLYVLVS
ncbi:hypothetical protein DFP72DRAFT_898748 [Ephemerocybe angulata]|uniref:Uncharacterized protein n=1 Tax=Ephemerocybe angulata TaxID=980116 RepID=A0A8H6HZQ7_9AGAR|nr:hypothetical protein DFP72DRAFT_898748 [Tulosesus angulatus]